MSQAAITLIVLVVAIILFVLDILPLGLVALCVPVVLYFLGIIEVGDIFTDVINSNVILIIAMCVIGAAFFKTGLAYKVSQKVMKLTHSEKGLILVVILLSGVMSGFVSNSGTVAVLLPIVMGIARAADIKPIKLLLPLVMGATLGADFTVIGSPGNLIAKNTIETYSNGTMHVGFFEYAKIGIPMLLAVAVFMFFFGNKLIKDRPAGEMGETNTDYSAIPKWHSIFTAVDLVATVTLMVLTDYVDFLPPIHIIACVGAILIVGLSAKDASLDYLKDIVHADGVITTKHSLIAHAKEIGLATVLRYFILDSMALVNIEKQQRTGALPDVIEILPGIVAPRVIRRIVAMSRTPVVCGGLIQCREDVMHALGSGASAISTTSSEVWYM